VPVPGQILADLVVVQPDLTLGLLEVCGPFSPRSGIAALINAVRFGDMPDFAPRW
jgi:hypothetical protein